MRSLLMHYHFFQLLVLVRPATNALSIFSSN